MRFSPQLDQAAGQGNAVCRPLESQARPRSRRGNEADCSGFRGQFPPPHVGGYVVKQSAVSNVSHFHSALRTARLSSPKSPHSSFEAAFTMVEIAICLAVIAFALVAIIGVLPIGMNAQKDNREETLINFDAHYLMDAIRSGSQGADTLTNYIICITNISTLYAIRANPQGGVTITPQSSVVNWYNTSTNNQGQYWQEPPMAPHQSTLLTNGFQIIGLLTRPRFVFYANGLDFISNYTTADFRTISGAASDQGYSQSSYDFAFRYRVTPEITPVGVADPSLTNYNAPNLGLTDIINRSNYMALATNMQNNLADIRLAFRWPVPPNGSTTNAHGSQVFRTMAGGMITNMIINSPTPMVRYFFEPYTYGTIAPTR